MRARVDRVGNESRGRWSDTDDVALRTNGLAASMV